MMVEISLIFKPGILAHCWRAALPPPYSVLLTAITLLLLPSVFVEAGGEVVNYEPIEMSDRETIDYFRANITGPGMNITNPGMNTTNPGPVNPGPVNPGPINPGMNTTNPGPINPGPINPGPINPGPVNPGNPGMNTTNPGPVNPGPINPGMNTTNPGPINPGMNTTNPGPINPGPINPGPINPGPVNPGPINPAMNTTNPGPINPGPINPGPINPGMNTTNPGPINPGPINPGMNTTNPGMNITDPGTNVTTPDVCDNVTNPSGCPDGTNSTLPFPPTQPMPPPVAPVPGPHPPPDRKALYGENCEFSDDHMHNSIKETCDSSHYLVCKDSYCVCHPGLEYVLTEFECLIPLGARCDEESIDLPNYMNYAKLMCQNGACLMDNGRQICRPETDYALIFVTYVGS